MKIYAFKKKLNFFGKFGVLTLTLFPLGNRVMTLSPLGAQSEPKALSPFKECVGAPPESEKSVSLGVLCLLEKSHKNAKN